MEEKNSNFPVYYNGYAGNGESLSVIARQLADKYSNHTRPVPAPFTANGPVNESNVEHPIYYDGSNGD